MGPGMVIHLPGLFSEIEKNVAKGIDTNQLWMTFQYDRLNLKETLDSVISQRLLLT